MIPTDSARRRGERPASASLYFLFILFVSLVLLVGTLFRYQVWELRGVFSLLAQLNLTGENNMAAWWSGILLLLAALHAYDAATVRYEQEPGAARGWMVLSLLLVALSADEVGSLHERAEAVLHWGPLGSLLPFAVVLIGLFVFALSMIAGGQGGARDATWIGIGFACFAASAGQEVLEHRLVWTGWSSSARGALEEGTELAGMMILIHTTLWGFVGRSGHHGDPSTPTFSLLRRHRHLIMAIALGLAPLLALATAGLDDPQRGRPADWASASLLAMGSLVVIRSFLQKRRIDRLSLLLLVLPAMAASLLFVAVQVDLFVLHDAPGGPYGLRAVAASAISPLLIAGWIARGRARGIAGIASILGLVILDALVLGIHDRFLAYWAYQGIGILVFARNAGGGAR